MFICYIMWLIRDVNIVISQVCLDTYLGKPRQMIKAAFFTDVALYFLISPVSWDL